MEITIWGVIIAILIVLMTRRWFWVFLFFIGGIACLFSMIASIIHFQILAAIGLFFLMGLCFNIAAGINDA